MPFFGRGDELAQLDARLRRALAGEPQLVVVDGPAGIGKTSLVRRFLYESGRSHCVLRGSGEELETGLSYGAVVQLLAGVPDPLDEPLAGLVRGGAADSRLPDPITVGSALVDLFGSLQDRAPLVVVLDDVHWADTPSLQAVTFALRRLRVDRVLTLLTARDVTDPRLPEGLRRLLGDDGTLKVTLTGLAVDDVVRLNEAFGPAELPHWAAARLCRHTGGNPLHTKALLRQFPVDVFVSDRATLPAPRGYERLIAARLEACTMPARRLVDAASVLGMSSPLHLAAELGAVHEPLGALAEAMACELLEEGPAGDMPQAVFPHPLSRAAVYQGLEPALRTHLHLRAASLADDLALRLQHRARAALGPDPELAAELGRLAGLQADAAAWSAAAASAQAAGRLSPDPERRARWLRQAVEYLLLAGDVSQAARLEHRVRELPPGAEHHYVLGHLALVAGRHEEARRELTACWNSRDTGTSTETMRSAAEQLAWLSLIESDGRATVDWAYRGLALPRARRSTFLRDSLALGLAFAGRPKEARAAVAHLPAGGAHSRPEERDGLFARGVINLMSGALDTACGDLKDAYVSHRHGGLASTALAALAFLADAEFRAGRWDDAVAHSTQAVSLAEDTRMSSLALAHAYAACPLAGRGLFQAAEAHASAAVEHARAYADVNDAVIAAAALAQVRAAQGDHEAVVTALHPFLDPAVEPRDALDEVGLVTWHAPLVEALTRTGRTDEADRVLRGYESRAAERDRWLDLAAAARCRGLLDGVRGDTDTAEQAFRAGLEHCARGEPCWEKALLQLSYGTFLRRTGRRGAAVDQLEDAWAVFRRLEAAPYLDQCLTELAACGRRTTRPADAARPVLTAQELTVARLAVQGLTNRQIARELVLSVKTIEYHLGNTYAKLGITSRMGLVSKVGPSP
ncbi:AAA family ATPase [Streptomyces sp. NPDC057257]|uniref:helix-turn-helix transcriptional regulator n=1 Tax=Streptomyces sp. NPDC057257 TaxID=3346071 RepID=UPI00362943EC